jgi:predicted metal-dependent hydrolase
MHQFKWREVPITYRNQNYQIGRTSLREAFRVLWGIHREQRKAGA